MVTKPPKAKHVRSGRSGPASRRLSTDSKPAGQRIHELQFELQVIYDTTPIGLAFLTLDCRYLQINQKLTEICGISVGDHIGRSVRDTVPAVADQVEALVSSIARTGEAVTGVEVRGQRADGSNANHVWITNWHPLKGQDGRIIGVNVVAEDITERKRAEEHQALLLAELDHRVKNILAEVAAITSSKRQGSYSSGEFLQSLDGRIRSMANAHSLLSKNGWQSVGIDALVRSQLAPYATGENVMISGTDIVLPSAEIKALSKVLHELTTNAAKYGALSVPDGKVSISWGRKPNGQAATLVLEWCEVGGPPVTSNVQSSYGTSLIRELIPHELGGNVDLVFASDGAFCRIEFPLEDLRDPAGRTPY